MNFKTISFLAWTALCTTTVAAQQPFFTANKVHGDEPTAGPAGTFLSDHFMVDTGSAINQDQLWLASYNCTGRHSPNGYGQPDNYPDQRIAINNQRISSYTPCAGFR